MSFLKGKSSFTVYRPSGIIPENIDELTATGPSVSKFIDIDATYDEYSVGWVSVFDMFDTSILPLFPHMVGGCVILSMRIDERKVPGSILKKFCRKEERRIMAEKQIPRLGRSYRAEIKERVKAEMIKTAKPIPSVFDMLWNREDNTVVFFSCSSRAKSIFEDLFKQTFGITLEQFQPFAKVTADTKSFLPWIWWKEETGSPSKIQGVDNSSITIGRKMRLAFANENVTCNYLSDQMAEARAALRSGKVMESATLHVAANDSEWSLVFCPSAFEFKSVRIPKVGEEEDEGLLMVTASLYLQVVSIMEGICADYLESGREDDVAVYDWFSRTEI